MATTATSKRATALPPDERRAAILDAVVPLVMEHGARVTTKQIAEAACIAEGTIFRVFDDKDQLFQAVGERMHDQTPREQAISEIDRDLPLHDQLVEAVAITQRRMVEIFTVLSRLGPAAHSREPRPLMDSPELTRIFAARPDAIAVDPAEASRVLRALTISMTHPMIAEEQASPERIVQLALHGIGNRDGSGA